MSADGGAARGGVGWDYNCVCVRVHSRVQWFWLFFTFWGITTHPWHPKDPRIWKVAKKNFQLHPWPAEIFGKNRKMRFFGLVSKFNFRSPVWQIFTIFSACFIYGIPYIHTKFEVSKSKNVVTREWSRQGSKFICLQNLRSKFINKNIFLKFFLDTYPIYYVLTMHFKPLKIFQLPNSIYIHIRRWLQQKLDFLLSECILAP